MKVVIDGIEHSGSRVSVTTDEGEFTLYQGNSGLVLYTDGQLVLAPRAANRAIVKRWVSLHD